MPVLVEDAAQTLMSADVETGDLRRIADRGVSAIMKFPRLEGLAITQSAPEPPQLGR
jgi:hypothetical protein